MQRLVFNPRLLTAAIFILLNVLNLPAFSQCIPLPNAFSHNDYFQNRPLLDALDNGYTNIEADIFDRDGELIVAHIDPVFGTKGTLETLYLKPLYARVKKNGGQVYKGYNKPVILMIDVKSDANGTYSRLRAVLQKYSDMLSSYDTGKVVNRAVTIVISGHKPFAMIKSEEKRFAFIDEDLRKTTKDTTTVNVYTMASCKYSKLLRWEGKGQIPEQEEKRICNYVNEAHKFGKKVRLWASPESIVVWQELLKCGVDLINTDDLVMLKDFLTQRNISFANSIDKSVAVAKLVN
jgi:hypothetical protein